MSDSVWPDVEEAYVAMTPGSFRAHQRALSLLPGGVSANNKFLRPYPLFIREGHGQHIVDVDGNTYLDLLLGAGVLILGHRPASVVAALRGQLENGTLFILPTELEFELASRMQRQLPFLEQIRFTNTGSEATIMAIRAARAATGRDLIGKFEGHFHGHGNDALAVSTGIHSHSLLPGRGLRSDWAGIPEHAVEDLLLLPWDDLDEAVRRIENSAHALAAVMLEPVPFSLVAIPDPAFLSTIRQVCDAHGILLIFDEIITGFRLSPGGAARYYGVSPDLATYGKIIGGGLPIGAFGGRRDIFERVVAPDLGPGAGSGRVFHSGTFTANPLSLVAGIATLDALAEEGALLYKHLAKLGDRLRAGLREVFAAGDIAAQVTGTESLLHVHFTEAPIRTVADVWNSDMQRNRAFCFGLMTRGVFWRVAHGAFVSTAHQTEDVDLVLAAAADVVAQWSAPSGGSMKAGIRAFQR